MSIDRLRRIALSLVAMAGALAAPRLCAADETPAPAPPPPPAEATPDSPPQDLKLGVDHTSRLTLSVMIDGQGPFEFLVDTGSDRTVISRELADQLKLPPGPAVKMHEPAGEEKVPTAMIDRLLIGDRLVKHIAAPTAADVNIGAAGVLGVDALKNLHLEMDFEAMRLSTSPSHEVIPAPWTVVVHGKSRFGQLILADAEIRGRRVYAVVDTGSDVSVGNPALLALLAGGQARSIGEVRLVSVTGRTTTAEVDLIPEADIGLLQIRGMPIAFAQDHIFDHLRLVDEPAILLGMDVLRLCRRITLDVRQRQASFTVKTTQTVGWNGSP
jgi:predicted aspartyl protease